MNPNRANRVKLEFWQTFRLFLRPFCVSSFAALVKGRGFVLIFSPNLNEIAAGAGLCLTLGALVAALKRNRRGTRQARKPKMATSWRIVSHRAAPARP